MRFRDFLSLLLVIIIGFFLFQGLAPEPADSKLAVNKFGEADISTRTAARYIEKNVNNPEQKEVIFAQTKNAESGSANIVTSVVANYRSLDTLGEVTVLFLAATGLGAVLYSKKKEQPIMDKDGSLILTTGVRILFPLLLLLGSYIFIHGHLTPGGGFQGGAVIATAFLLNFLAYSEYSLNHKWLEMIESLSGFVFVTIGIIGFMTAGYFLYNFLDTGTVGRLFSAGIIPLIYVSIGFKVGAELTGIIDNLIRA